MVLDYDKNSAEEQAFMQKIHERPDDEFLPLVYADWLDDQGDLRGTALRLMLDRDRISRQGITNQALIESLDKEIETLFDGASEDGKVWYSLLNMLFGKRATILKRGFGRSEPNPIFQFEFECPNRWYSLQVTKDATVRFCGDCQRQVHFCSTPTEAEDHARRGNCIAVASDTRSNVVGHRHPSRDIMVGLPGRPDYGPFVLPPEPPAKSSIRRWVSSLFGWSDK